MHAGKPKRCRYIAEFQRFAYPRQLNATPAQSQLSNGVDAHAMVKHVGSLSLAHPLQLQSPLDCNCKSLQVSGVPPGGGLAPTGPVPHHYPSSGDQFHSVHQI
ncbi:hypothetical protein DPEC_G00145230 [Dallia pectoralis]|uniref:Uncharacterized protein n=1 Tax=Dallia pectoralis TaxID=75939 RepID=A0ACC2GPG8_DALPE|nr:hypothetical protein DPEC_G00145230 [Dallia pectoralis]